MVALIPALVSACAGRTSRPGTRQGSFVEVHNRGYADMTVYIVEGGSRIRLGLANGNSTVKLAIPASIVGGGRELQFLADPIGSQRTSVSDRIMVLPGDTVVLTIVR
jgi:hypothetical protein